MAKINFGNKNDYNDIISLPHHVSEFRAHMPVSDRAAQFSPFAALTGFEDAITETGRLTDERIELDIDEREALDEKLRGIQERIKEQPAVEIIYFQPDYRKAGGAYLTAAGRIKRIDLHERAVIMQDGTKIPVREIAGLEEK